MKLSQTQLAIIALIVANIIWGATAPILKWTLEDVPPFTLSFIRFFVSALILFPFTVHKLKIKREDIMLLLYLSVIGLGIRIAYNTYGLTLTTSINSPIIASAAPIFLILGSVALLHEKAKKKVINGTVLSLLGVILITVFPAITKGFDKSILGNIFFMVSMGLSVVYILLLKQLSPKYSALTILFWMFTLASVSFLPFTVIELARTNFTQLLHPHALIGMSFGTLFSTIFAYILNLYGVRFITASEVGIFTYVDPIIAILVASQLLGEHVTSIYLIGSLFVFLGIFIAEGRVHYHPIHLLRRREEVEVVENQAYLPEK